MNRTAVGWGICAAKCAVAAALIVTLGTGCGLYRGPDRHMRRGDRYFEKREYEKAAIEYLNVVRAQPTNSVALLRMGVSYFEAGLLKKAFPALLKARECGSKSDELAMKLASMYLWAGRREQARAEIVTLLDRGQPNLKALLLLVDVSRTPDQLKDARTRLLACEKDFAKEAAYHIALGALNARTSDLDGAARAYEAAIAIAPQSPDAYMHMANLCARRGDTNRAESVYAKAATLAAPDSAVHLHWAVFNAGRGKREAARQILEKAVAAAPGFLQARFALAELALEEQRVDDALSICDAILKQNPGHPQSRLMRARILLARGRTDEAAKECERLLNAYPRSAEAMLVMAQVNLRQKNATQAMALLSKAVAVNTNFVEAVILLAELNLRTGHPEAVIASLPALIDKAPRLPQPYTLLGAAYRAVKRTEDAIVLYRRMAKVFPKDPRCLFVLGASLRDAGKEDEAAVELKAALELNPGFVEPLAMLVAQDLRLRKDIAGAVARVERQIQLAPKEAELYNVLGRVYLAAKDTAKAEAALKRALELSPDSVGTLVALSQIYGTTGQRKEALASLERALGVNSNNVQAMVLSACLLEQDGRYKQARDRFERLLALSPKSVVAANNLAYLCSEQLNDPERALTLATSARELAPNDPYVADTLGWILCRRGEWKRALGLLRESAGQLADQADVLYHLAVCRATLGDDVDARAGLTQALKIQADFSQAASARRLLAALEADPATLDKDGLSALESLAEEALFSVPVLARIGRAHELANRPKPARDAYQKAIARYAEHPGALLGLARLKALEGDSAAVLDLVKRARNAASADPVTGLVAGRLALRHGDARWALGILQEVAGRLPDNPDAQYALAVARFHAGQVRAALELARTALQSTTSFDARKEAELFAAVVALWNAPGTDGSVVAQEARAALKTAGADWLPALALQARAQALQNDAAGEIETLERVATAAPDFSPAVVRLANIYAGRPKDREKAYKLALRAREMLPADPAVASVLGRLEYWRKDAKRAEQLLDEALKGTPQDAEVVFYLGLARYQSGNKVAGRRLLEQALAVRTDFTEIAVARGILAEPPPK